MVGLLAVPVGVLLLVVVLALMGRRWSSPGPLGEADPLDDAAEFDEPADGFERPPLPPYAPAPATRTYGYRPPSDPPARHSYGPPAQAPYGSPAYDQYGSPAQQPYWSAPREPYGSHAHEPYGRPAQGLYHASAHDSYGQSQDDPESEQPPGFPYGPYEHR
jgi:hypothetical protein